MSRYGPRGYTPRQRGRRVNGPRLGLTIGIVAAVIVVVVLCVNVFGGAKDEEPVAQAQDIEVLTNVFEDGVSVGGVDVSGLTMEEAKIAVTPAVNELLNAGTIEFAVTLPSQDGDEEAQAEPQTYTYSLEELGAGVDVDAALNEAMAYRNETPAEEEQADDGVQLSSVSAPEKDFPLARTLDTTVAEATINALAESSEWEVEPVNARYKPNYYSDESSLTTGGEMVQTEPADGYRVKTEDIIATISGQIETDDFTPFMAEIETIPGSATVDDGRKPMLMASATTDFSKSPEGRQYNIWKISEKLNGVTFQPGVTFSVNDHVGDRNAENGWKEANGIENGVYTPQYGGGICQVSSTMYNATLKAEMKIVNRVPHTIMASYVKPGLDATISTGGPDFKVENPYADQLYMIVKCNVPDRKVTVEIWGYEDRGYYVELDSELISEKEGQKPAPEFTVNASMNPYAISEVRPGRRYEKYQLYATRIDSETDQVIEDKIPVGTSTYNAIVGKYEVGSGVPITPGMTLEDAQAAAAAAAAAVAAPPPEEVAVIDPGVETPQQPETPETPETPPDNTGGEVPAA